MVGAIEIGLGLGKLGFVADLLSKEVQAGYMNGLAITIIVGQLPKLFGFSTDADGFIQEVGAFFAGLDATNAVTLAVGLATLVVMLGLPRLTKKVPAVLVAVGGATIVTAAFSLADQGVKTVGTLPSGLPVPALPWTSVSDLAMLAAAAVGIVLVSLTDTIATSTSFAARRGDEVDPNQEMIGVGAANVAAGLFQGFAVSVSGSRTAVADQAGRQEPGHRPGRRRTRHPAARLLSRVPQGPAPDGAGSRRHRGSALTRRLRRLTCLLARAQDVARALARGDGGRHPVRRSGGYPRRGPSGDHPLLPAELVAAGRGPRL